MPAYFGVFIVKSWFEAISTQGIKIICGFIIMTIFFAVKNIKEHGQANR